MEKVLSILNKEVNKIDSEISKLQNDNELIKLKKLVKTYNADIKSVDVNLIKRVVKLDSFLVTKLNFIISHYDIIIAIDDEDTNSFYNRIIEQIGRMLFSKYDDLRKNNNDAINLLIEKKRKLELLSSKLSLINLNDSYESISEILDLIDDAPLYAKKKKEIVLLVNKYFFDNANKDNINEVVDEEVSLKIDDEVIASLTQVEEITECVVDNFELISEDNNSEFMDQFLFLKNEVKKILNENRVYTDDIYNLCEKYHIDFDMFMNYLNKEDYDNLIGLLGGDVSTLYLDFIKSLYDLKDCMTFGDTNILESSITFIEDAIESFNYFKEIYLNSSSLFSISYYDKFIASSKTILLFAKDKDGNYTIDSTLKTGDSNQMSLKEQAVYETIKTFSSIPYMSDNSSNNCEMAYSGSREKKARARIDVVYKNNPVKKEKKKIVDSEFGTSHKRYRTNNYPRVSYVVIPICDANRSKLAEVFDNFDLLHTTSVVVFTGSCYVTSGHEEYSVLNDALDRSRENIRYLKKVFGDPKTDIKVLTDIVNESMEYAFDYIDNKSNIKIE